MIYFTADQHFGHYNIIECFNRPFKSDRQMDKQLIANWNETVTDDDIVYVLGDLTMKGLEQKSYVKNIVNRLNGHKHLILGNHDLLKPSDYVEIGFISVHTSLDLWIPAQCPWIPGYTGPGERFILNHDPAASITMKNQTWLVGHVHTLFKTLGNAINVGVDVHNFRPVSLDTIRSIRDAGPGFST